MLKHGIHLFFVISKLKIKLPNFQVYSKLFVLSIIKLHLKANLNTMKQLPALVSVIIPTYQRAKFLTRAIDSVRDQTYKSIEIIVVDDNGEGKQQEESRSIVAKYQGKVRLITYEKNRGACYARNEGAKHAKGEILMFLDDDDYYFNNKVSLQAAILNDDAIDACLCAMKKVDEFGNEIYAKKNFPKGIDLKSYLLHGNGYTVMIAIKKKVFEKLNGFDEIPVFEDKYFMYKLHQQNYKVQLLNEPLFCVYEHAGTRASHGGFEALNHSYEMLYKFEKENKHLFSEKEFAVIKSRHFLEMSSIRASGNLNQRLEGMKYLILACFARPSRILRSFPFLMKLLMSHQVYRVFFKKSRIKNVKKPT